jgi:hypothetical protein
MTSRPEDGDRRAALIEDEIGRTRAELTETLREIRRRLRPTTLFAQAQATVRDVTAREAQNLAALTNRTATYVIDRTRVAAVVASERVRENPMLAALVSLGLGFVTTAARRSNGGGRKAEFARQLEPTGFTASGRHLAWGSIPVLIVGTGAWLLLQRGNGHGQSERRDARDPSMLDAPAGIGAGAERDVLEMGRQARLHAGDYLARAQTRLDHMLRRDPLPIGAAAAAIGAVLGVLLPQSREEKALVGKVRESLRDDRRRIAALPSDVPPDSLSDHDGPSD